MGKWRGRGGGKAGEVSIAHFFFVVVLDFVYVFLGYIYSWRVWLLAFFILCRARALERQIAFDEESRKTRRCLCLCVCVRESEGVREGERVGDHAPIYSQCKSKKIRCMKKQDVVFITIHRCN